MPEKSVQASRAWRNYPRCHPSIKDNSQDACHQWCHILPDSSHIQPLGVDREHPENRFAVHAVAIVSQPFGDFGQYPSNPRNTLHFNMGGNHPKCSCKRGQPNCGLDGTVGHQGIRTVVMGEKMGWDLLGQTRLWDQPSLSLKLNERTP